MERAETMIKNQRTKGLTIDIVVPTRNRPEECLGLLDNLKRQEGCLINKIIIVDGSDNKLINISKFKEKFSVSNFKMIKPVYIHTKDYGLTKQKNLGLSNVSSDLVCFVDDDMRFEKLYIKKLVNNFQDNKDYAGGMGTLVKHGSNKISLNKILRKVFLLQKEHSNGKFTFSGMPTHSYGTNNFHEVDVLDGTAVYRYEYIKDIKFDETLGAYAYMEDCDFSKRVSNKYKLFFNPECKRDHLISSKNRDKVVVNRAMYIRNYSYLFFKNFYPENKLRIFGYLWSVIGLFTEAILARNINYLKGYCLGLKRYYFNKI